MAKKIAPKEVAVEPKTVAVTVEEVKPEEKKDTEVTIRATQGFFDLQAGKSRTAGDEWKADKDRANSLKKLGLAIVL